MNKVKRSFLNIIIPNYNSGKLLSRCVNSILTEQNTDYHIIIVDDGSTDNSARRIESNSRITVVYQDNQGVAAARNKGINVSNADYLLFVDADDTLKTHWGEMLKVLNTQHSDLFIFNYFNNQKKVKVIDKEFHYSKTNISAFLEKSLKNPTKFMMTWGKVFKAKLIYNNSLKFNTNLRLAEDGDFLLRYLLLINDVREYPEYLYYYQNNPHSVMRTFDTNKVKDYLLALRTSQKVVSNQVDDQLTHWFSFYILMHLNIMMVHEVFDIDNQDSFGSKIKSMKKIISQPIISNALKNVSLNECNSVRMLPILLIKCRLYFIAAELFSIRSKQNHH